MRRTERATHPRWGLVFSGLGVLLTGQAVAILLGAMDGFRDAAAWTLLPGAGPWIATGVAASDPHGCLVKGTDCNAFPSVPALIAAGVIQLAGATLFSLGFAFPKRVEASRVAVGPSGLAIAF